MYRLSHRKYVVRRSLVAIFLVLATMIAGLPAQARAECDPAAVWLTLPESSQVANVNKQLMTDSGPTVNHHIQTTTYSRRWQGAGSSRSLSITIIIHPTVKVAADSVKSYGESLLKSNEGQKVSLGNLGFRTNQIKRPYFMVHKGRFVVTYYTSYPGRSGGIPDIPTEEQTIREILSKISSLPCFSSTGQPPPPQNNCPTVTLSFSPTQPLPTDTIIMVAKATDPDGDKLSYDWEIKDVRSIRLSKKAGSRLTWKPPGPERYFVKVSVSDGQCGTYDKVQIPVFANPNRTNQAPIISLSVKPNPAQVDQMIVFTATVSDPEGDSITAPRWTTSNIHPINFPLKKRVGNTFTYKAKFPAGMIAMQFSVKDVRNAPARKNIHLVVTDPNQLLNVKLSCDSPAGQRCKIKEGGQIKFTAVANNPKQEPLTYAWSIDGKQKKSWQGAQVVWYNVPYKPNNYSCYTIKVQVWKKNGKTAGDDILLCVDPMQPPPPPPPPINSKPKVTLICLTANPQTGQPVRFKATVSDPDAGDKLTWNWSLNSKAVKWSSLTPSWNNPSAGKHSVKITVSDGTYKVSTTETFTVQAPPPPPATMTIIQSAEFVDNATSSVWGSSTKSQWQAGEEINLRIDLKPVSRSHNLEIIWQDAAGKLQKREPAAVSAGPGWGQGETIWSTLRSTANDAVGTWTVEILVDGRLDRTLNFRLGRRKKSFSSRGQSLPPAQQPGSRSRSRPAPSTSGATGGTPQPSSTWKSAF